MSYQERRSLTPSFDLFSDDKFALRLCKTPISFEKTRPLTPLDLFKQRAVSPANSQTSQGTVYSRVSEVEDLTKRENFFYVASIDKNETRKLVNHPQLAQLGIDLFDKPPVINNKWITPLAVTGLVSSEIFAECLKIYENNQACLIESYNNDIYEEDDIINGALMLEEWFFLIIEPFSGDKEWQSREVVFKLTNNFTEYCLKQIREMIGGVREPVRQHLVEVYRYYGLLQ